jgi:hypothetical protein
MHKVGTKTRLQQPRAGAYEMVRRAVTRLRLSILLVLVVLVTTVVALVGTGSPLAAISVTPGCNAHAVVSLDIAAGAQTPSGSGSTVGTAQAGQLASALETGAGNVCTTAAGSAVRTKLAAIASLYRTNRTAAHQELVSLLAEIKSGTIHAPLPFAFHYKLTGKIIGTRFIITAPSTDFNLTNPFHG